MIDIVYQVMQALFSELRSRRRTVRLQIIAFTVSLLAALLGGVIPLALEQQKKKDPDYAAQIKALNNVESNLKGLIDFVEAQKRRVADTETVVTTLKQEEEKLRPMVEADRKVVDAILEAQQSRQSARIWKERLISFFLGVMASIVASFIFSAVRLVLRRRTEDTRT